MCAHEKKCAVSRSRKCILCTEKAAPPNGGEGRQHHQTGEGKTATPHQRKEETKQHTPNKEGEKLKKNEKNKKEEKGRKHKEKAKTQRENSEDEARTTPDCLEPLKKKKTTKPADKPKKGPVPKTGFNHPESFDLGAFFPHFFF